MQRLNPNKLLLEYKERLRQNPYNNKLLWEAYEMLITHYARVSPEDAATELGVFILRIYDIKKLHKNAISEILEQVKKDRPNLLPLAKEKIFQEYLELISYENINYEEASRQLKAKGFNVQSGNLREWSASRIKDKFEAEQIGRSADSRKHLDLLDKYKNLLRSNFNITTEQAAIALGVQVCTIQLIRPLQIKAEMKEEFIQKFLELRKTTNKIPIGYVAKQFGIAHGTLNNWLKNKKEEIEAADLCFLLNALNESLTEPQASFMNQSPEDYVPLMNQNSVSYMPFMHQTPVSYVPFANQGSVGYSTFTNQGSVDYAPFMNHDPEEHDPFSSHGDVPVPSAPLSSTNANSLFTQKRKRTEGPSAASSFFQPARKQPRIEGPPANQDLEPVRQIFVGDELEEFSFSSSPSATIEENRRLFTANEIEEVIFDGISSGTVEENKGTVAESEEINFNDIQSEKNKESERFFTDEQIHNFIFNSTPLVTVEGSKEFPPEPEEELMSEQQLMDTYLYGFHK